VITRRELFKFIGAGAVAVAAGELILPSRKIFLPPRGGWPESMVAAMLNREAQKLMNAKYLEMVEIIDAAGHPALFPPAVVGRLRGASNIILLS
jgi:hypothetical protein